MKSGNKIIITTIILFAVYISPSLAFSTGNIEWASPISGTLYKGDILANGNYTVKAVELPGPVLGHKTFGGDWTTDKDVEPGVLLELYKNGILINSFGMGLNDTPFIDSDYEVKISVTGFPAKNAKEWVYQYYGPWVNIDIQLRAIPKVDVVLSTDKSEYTSNEDNQIDLTTTVTNNGDTFAQNIDVYIDIGDLKPISETRDQFHKYYSRLEKGESQSFEVKLLVPDLIEEKTYTLNGTSRSFDTKDIEYDRSSDPNVITVIPKQNFLDIYKTVKDNMYLNETAAIRITVVNGGVYNVHDLRIKDSIDENFELVGETPFDWNVSTLAPGMDWKVTYYVKPVKTNIDGFIIPSATVDFIANDKQYSMASAQPTIIVNGPQILAVKTVDKKIAVIGDIINVVTTVNNLGDIPTKIEIDDSLPEGVTLVNGSTHLNSTYLDLTSSQLLTYRIRVDTTKEITLPPARVNFTDIVSKGEVKSSTYSNLLTINEKNLSVNVTSIPVTPQETKVVLPTVVATTAKPTSGFEIIYTIVILISIIKVFRRK